MNKTEYNENQFDIITDNSYSRPAQIPIREARLNYLLNEYSPSANDRYVMFSHPGHFMICDTNTMKCIIDATYEIIARDDANSLEDKISAVVSSMTFYEDETTTSKRADMFKLVANLINMDL